MISFVLFKNQNAGIITFFFFDFEFNALQMAIIQNIAPNEMESDWTDFGRDRSFFNCGHLRRNDMWPADGRLSLSIFAATWMDQAAH